MTGAYEECTFLVWLEQHIIFLWRQTTSEYKIWPIFLSFKRKMILMLDTTNWMLHAALCRNCNFGASFFFFLYLKLLDEQINITKNKDI